MYSSIDMSSSLSDEPQICSCCIGESLATLEFLIFSTKEFKGLMTKIQYSGL